MYGELKDLLLQALEVSPARLHIMVGVAFYTLCVTVTRRPWLSLSLLLALQFGNEFLDAREDMTRGGWSPREAVFDTAWTVVIPAAMAGTLAAIKAVVSALPHGSRKV